MTTTSERRFDPIENPWAAGAPASWPDRRGLAVGGALVGLILAMAALDLASGGEPLLVALRATVLVAAASVAGVWLAREIMRLREAEERYALVVAAADTGIWDWDLVNDRLFMSPRTQDLVGLEPSAVSVRRWTEWETAQHYHPEDWQRRQTAMRDHLEGRTPRYEGEWRIRQRDGSYRWVLGRGLCVRDSHGRPTRFAGTTTDIDARKRAEQELRESEKRFELAIAGADYGIWDRDLVNDRVYFSPRALELLGRPGHGPWTGSSAEWADQFRLHPDDVLPRESAMREHLQGRTPHYEGEWRYLQPDGTYRWIRSRGVCTCDGSGRAVRFTGSVTDVDARKRTADALRRSEQCHALIMEATGEGWWDWNILADDFQESPRLLAMCGFPPGSTFKNRADFLDRFPYHPEDRPKWEDAVAAHFAGTGTRLEMDMRIELHGELRWLHLTGVCLRDAAGRPVRWMGAVSDVTERKQAEDALRLSEERYARAMDASDAGHWEWNLATDEFFVSTRAKEMLCITVDQLPPTRTETMALVPMHPDDRRVMVEAVQAGVALGRYEREYRVVPRPGEVRWLRSRGKVFRDKLGAAVRMTGSLTDITGRKLAEEALRQSEGRFALAVAGSNDGLWDWDVVTDQMFLSERAQRIYGLEPGVTVRPRAEWRATVVLHPDDAEPQRRAVEDYLAGSEPGYEGEWRVRRKDGSFGWIRIRGQCVRDAAGRPVRFAGSVSDIDTRKRAEAALRESEERFTVAVAGSIEGIFDWDLATDCVFMSSRAQQLFEMPAGAPLRPRDEWLAMVRYHPDDVERLRQGIRAHVSGATPAFDVEFRAMLADGCYRWFRQRGVALQNAAGKAYRMAGSIEDVTERKLAAEALRESEARFRSLTELSSDWYWRQDENLRFTYLSSEGNELAGYPADISIGKTRWELPHVTPLSCPWSEHQAVLAARQPFRDFEYCRVDRDGSTRYISISGAPIFDEQGQFAGYQGVGRSITERKRVEEELRARQEMLDLAQKAARAVAFEWHIGAGEGQDRWSPDLEALYGLAPGSYDGTFDTWKRLVWPEDLSAVTAAIERAAATGDVAADYRIVHPDGAARWLQAKGRMFFDAAGRPARVVGFMLDVTERRQAEEELRRLERQLRQAQRLEAMGTLAGGIAHDFNNILGAILGYGEMALRDAPKGSRLRRDLGSIMTAGERGRALVERILAFSRSGVGERVAVHVAKVIGEVLGQIEAKLPANMTVEGRLSAGRAAVLGDPTQVYQVMMNLATNAVQAMPSGGVLRVSLDPVRFEAPRATATGLLAAGEYLVLEVADCGVGMAPDVLERIFDPFFTTKEVGVGTGLGLSLVHGIVSELGGAVDVASTPGAGSVFTVYLPRAGDAADDCAPDEPPVPRGSRQQVLIVDDEEQLVRLATERLSELGYRPVGFTSPAAALAAFRADPGRFDAVITDERMPGVSGSALIRELRAIRREIPILLVSGYLGAAVVRRAREAGADEVLKKPFSASTLATSLARVLHAAHS